VTKYHRRLRCVLFVNSVDESSVSWASRIAGSEKNQAELSDVRLSDLPMAGVAPTY
jgi:hypothetical protein